MIHVVRSDSFAGVERSIAASSRALAQRGHSVVVIGGDPKLMDFHLAGEVEDVRPAASLRDTVRELRRAGRADIVHAHMTAAELAAVATRTRHRAALVCTRHFALQRGSSPLGRVAAVAINRIPLRQIAISEYVAHRIDGPSTVVHHGLARHEPVGLAATAVLVAQRLEAEKHTDVAIRAWAMSGLPEQGWTLLIAGDGAELGALRALSRELLVESSVEFLGRVADVNELRWKSAMQLATPPGEHFGLSVLEAMGCGLPVVAADGGAHREILGETYPAMFEAGDHHGAAAVMAGLATSLDARRALGTQLRDRQLAHFSLASHGEALEAVYQLALDDQHG